MSAIKRNKCWCSMSCDCMYSCKILKKFKNEKEKPRKVCHVFQQTPECLRHNSVGHVRRRRDHLTWFCNSLFLKTQNLLQSLHWLPLHCIGNWTNAALNHGQMTVIVHSWEERVARVEFEEEATERPNITGLVPTKFLIHFISSKCQELPTQNDIGRTVVSSRDNFILPLAFENSGSQINESNGSIL